MMNIFNSQPKNELKKSGRSITRDYFWIKMYCDSSSVFSNVYLFVVSAKKTHAKIS